MVDTITIPAELRTEFGKGAARRIRRADKVPAVLYGHGTDPQHLTLPGHPILLALRQANALLTLQIEGKEQLALPKQVQRDPIKGFIEHVDLLIVRRGEKVTVEVPVVLTGEAAAETLVNQDLNAISLEVEATSIPEQIEVSIEGLEAGSQIFVSDLSLPQGAAFTGEAPEETLVVGVNEAVELEVESEEEAPEGEAEADQAEGDVVESIEGEAKDADDSPLN